MGSPISPIAASLYMEDFEMRAINTSPHPPLMWKRFVDDTFVVIKAAHKQNFLDHVNSVDHRIQFTSEDPRPDGSMSFLDILVTPGEDGSLSTTVYRKLTYTDLYMQLDSHHTISSKHSVIGTLHHRAKAICSSPQLLQQEEDHLYRVLTRCKCPAWALNRFKIKMRTPSQRNQKRNNSSNTNNQKGNQNPYIVVPYSKGLSESMKRTCNKHGQQVYFKGGNIIRNFPVAPKDKDPMLKKSGVIYRYKCDSMECAEKYIENQPEHLERGSRNIKRPHPPNMTIITLLVKKLA